MFCLFCTQGHMTHQDLRNECRKEKWLPILIMRVNGEIIVPVFSTIDIASKFVKRNLPKGWLCGTVTLTVQTAEWMDSQGWKAIKYDFPRKLKDLVEFDIEVVELDDLVLHV